MQTIKIDISQKNNVPLLYVKQRDVGHKFLIELYENGKIYTVNENYTVSVWYSGASGEGNYTHIGEKVACEIEGNKITVEMIVQMLNEPGGHEMCVVVYDHNNQQKGFWNIPYFVEAIPGADSEAATAYYNAFLDAQKKAEEAAERAEAAADRAESAGGGGNDAKPKDVIVTAEFEAAIPDPTGATDAMVANGTSDLTALEIATAIRGGATVKLIDNDNIVYEYDGYRLEPSNTMARFKAEVPTEEGIKVYRVNIDNELYAGRVETLIAYGGGSSVNVVQILGDSETAVMSQKAVTDYFDDLSNEKRVPTRFEFEAGEIGETGVLRDSATDIRTADFHELDCEYLIVEKENCRVYVMHYDNNGNFLRYAYSGDTETLAPFPIYPGRKYKIRITNCENGAPTPYENIASVLAKVKFYKKNERFITEADLNQSIFVKHDMAVGYKDGWINTNGVEYWSQAARLYKFTNTGFSKAKVYSYADNDVTAALVFYSTDGSIISLVPYKNNGAGAWYEADVPKECASFAIVVRNNDTYPPQIMLSFDGFHSAISNIGSLFIDEDTTWED